MKSKSAGSSALAAMVGLILHGGTGAAQESVAPVAMSLPVQPLRDALNSLARQTGLQVIYMADEVTSGITAPGLEGRFTPEHALKVLLKGSGLTFEFLNPRTVAITVPGADRAKLGSERTDWLGGSSSAAYSMQGAGGASAIRLAQANRSSPASSGEAQSDTSPRGKPGANEVLEEIVVRAVQFRYDEAMSASKLPISVKDTPQTVKVVTEDLLEFAGIRKFEDLYKIDASAGTSNQGDQIPRNFFRGFKQQGVNTVKVDGFRMTADIQLDLAPFERFEIVKGPTSTLYGQNSIGGTLNAISKAPQDTFGGALSFETGSYEHYRGDLDFYGPLTADGALTYRLVGAYLDEDSYVNFFSNKRWVVAPSLRYEFSPNTSILARVNYQDFDFTPYYGFGAQFLGADVEDPAQLTPENFRVPDVPRSRTGNAPGHFANKEALFAQTVLEHAFGNTWNLRGSLSYNRAEDLLQGVLLTTSDQNGVVSSADQYIAENDDEAYAAEVNLFGDVEVFGRSHTLFLGLDYAQLTDDSLFYFNSLAGADTGFNILDPDYSLIPFPAGIENYQGVFITNAERRLSGATAQVLLRPLDALTVNAGARYSRERQDLELGCCDLTVPRDQLERKANESTFQLGLTYEMTEHVNLYASYGETFEPQSVFLGTEGALLDPEEGEGYEVGVKGDALSGRQLEAPEFGVSLFTSYEIQGGPLQGLGFGGGVVHKSGRDYTDVSLGGRTLVSFLDDYTELDLRVFYTHQRWQFQLSGTNVLDELYYSNGFPFLSSGFQSNPPRQVMGTVRYRF